MNYKESYIELPSGRLVKVDDIIYISDIKKVNEKYQVKVTWGNRSIEIFEYDDKFICENDVDMIKTIIFS